MRKKNRQTPFFGGLKMCQMISDGVRKLDKTDGGLSVEISSTYLQIHLVGMRDGMPIYLPISHRVAEELIAMGLAYGD
jgi:hypothetical protein